MSKIDALKMTFRLIMQDNSNSMADAEHIANLLVQQDAEIAALKEVNLQMRLQFDNLYRKHSAMTKRRQARATA